MSLSVSLSVSLCVSLCMCHCKDSLAVSWGVLWGEVVTVERTLPVSDPQLWGQMGSVGQGWGITTTLRCLWHGGVVKGTG